MRFLPNHGLSRGHVWARRYVEVRPWGRGRAPGGEEAWQLASGHLRCRCERDLCCYTGGEGVEARRREQPVVGREKLAC